MDEETRRAEILQAEEAVRLLAEELARTASATAAAEELRHKLDQMVAALTGAKDALAKAAQVHAAAAEASRAAVHTAAEETRVALAAAGQPLHAACQDVQAACREFCAAADQVVQKTGRLAETLEGRLKEVASSVADVKLCLADLAVSPPDVEARLAELAASVAGLSTALVEARHEARNTPGEIVTQLRRGLRKQKAVFAAILMLSAATFLAVCIALWLLVPRGGAG